jgi:hypothetical protein
MRPLGVLRASYYLMEGSGEKRPKPRGAELFWRLDQIDDAADANDTGGRRYRRLKEIGAAGEQTGRVRFIVTGVPRAESTA